MSESASQDLVTLSFLLPSILVCDVLVARAKTQGCAGRAAAGELGCGSRW